MIVRWCDGNYRARLVIVFSHTHCESKPAAIRLSELAGFLSRARERNTERMEKMGIPWIKALKQRGYHPCNLVNVIKSRDDLPWQPEEECSEVLFSLGFSQIDRETTVQHTEFEFG